MEHLQAKGLFEGSKLAGIFFPFNRRISFIFAGSSWISFVEVFSLKLRHSSRTRRITAAIVCGRGERNTRWAIIAHSRSMSQKSSIFGGNQKGWMWRRRWRVGVWLGKISSMKSLFKFLLSNSLEALCQSSKLLIAIITKTKFVNFCQNFKKNLDFLYFFFEKIFLFQVVILKIVDFLYMFFCNIRLWKRPRHGLKIVYTVHKT